MKQKYFIAEIHERETMSKTLNTYTAVFDDVDRTFLVLSATNGVVSIASFTAVITAPVRITKHKAWFNFFF